MKTDNTRHWLYLIMFRLIAFAMLLRPVPHRRPSGRVLLDGHKLSGIPAVTRPFLSRPLRLIQAFALPVWPMAWQYRVFFLFGRGPVIADEFARLLSKPVVALR